MSVVQDWVNGLPDAAQLELLMAVGSGDFQDCDTVSGLLNYARWLVFKDTRFAKGADFGFTDIKYIKEEIGKYSARYVRALIVYALYCWHLLSGEDSSEVVQRCVQRISGVL